MELYDELKDRGLIYQVSDEASVKRLLNTRNASFYAGFDPTASSLHIGHLLVITFMKRLEAIGLRPIALVGGATGLIGDPSGKAQERILNPEEVVEKWALSLKEQLGRFLNFSKDAAILVNNYDWLKNVDVLSFLRDIGKHFNVNEMLDKESVKIRLESGISYTEFSYTLLQAFDFSNLYQKYNCRLQIGGSDQWGNITAGIGLIRKLAGQEAFGLTIPLVTKADGTKFGKTESGTIWLDAGLTSPYHFYQFWINVDDRDVVKFLKYFTFLPLGEIGGLEEKLKNQPEKRDAHKILAEEVTVFVHGDAAYERAKRISDALFYGDVNSLGQDELMEVFSNVAPAALEKFSKINVIDFLTAVNAVNSKRQAREDIKNGAIEISGKKITDIFYEVTQADFLFGHYMLIKRGKKDYHFVKI